VSYLGHVISSEGVAMDNTKVDSVKTWSQPRSARGLRGFLGLAGYYMKFIKDFEAIVAPLTQLLKKQSFKWIEDAIAAFNSLKNSLTTAHVLQFLVPTMFHGGL
jgi:hypothetical protein